METRKHQRTTNMSSSKPWGDIATVLLRLSAPGWSIALLLYLAQVLSSEDFAAIGVALLVVSSMNFPASGAAIRMLGYSVGSESGAEAYARAHHDFQLAAVANATLASLVCGVVTLLVTDLTLGPVIFLAWTTFSTHLVLVQVSYFRIVDKPIIGLLLSDNLRYSVTAASFAGLWFTGSTTLFSASASIALGSTVSFMAVTFVVRISQRTEPSRNQERSRVSVLVAQRQIFGASAFAAAISLTYRLDLVGLAWSGASASAIASYVIAVRIFDGANLCLTAPEYLYLPRSIACLSADPLKATLLARKGALVALSLVVPYSVIVAPVMLYLSPNELRGQAAIAALILGALSLVSAAAGFNASLPLALGEGKVALRISIGGLGVGFAMMFVLSQTIGSVFAVAVSVAATGILIQLALSVSARFTLGFKPGLI